MSSIFVTKKIRISTSWNSMELFLFKGDIMTIKRISDAVAGEKF